MYNCGLTVRNKQICYVVMLCSVMSNSKWLKMLTVRLC